MAEHADASTLESHVHVTPQMIQEGLADLRDLSFHDSLDYMVESVFRAMAYAALDDAGTMEIVVAPTMIAAGLERLRKHTFGDPLEQVVESVYRAMSQISTNA